MPWTNPETFTAGQTLTAASMNIVSGNDSAIRAAQINVQQGTRVDSDGIANAGSYVAAGLSVSITPTSASSKVLVTAHVYVGASTAMSVGAKLTRNTSDISAALPASPGSRRSAIGTTYVEGSAEVNPISFVYLDSPNTTSATTYSVSLINILAGTAYINRSGADTNSSSFARAISTITAMEIPA
jgi:hypothetical protein